MGGNLKKKKKKRGPSWSLVSQGHLIIGELAWSGPGSWKPASSQGQTVPSSRGFLQLIRQRTHTHTNNEIKHISK